MQSDISQEKTRSLKWNIRKIGFCLYFSKDLTPNILLFPVDNSMRSYYISTIKLPDFEWDDFKNAQNTEKHGVSFYEAQYAFADTQRVIIEDLDHGGDEDRFFCFGKVRAAS